MIIAIIGSAIFFLIMVLYIALTFGAPLGEFALGGKNKILPAKQRIACAVSVLIQALAIYVLLQMGSVLPQTFSKGLLKGLGYFFSFYLVINVFMNAISKSNKEKFVMTPISVILAFCFLYTTFST